MSMPYEIIKSFNAYVNDSPQINIRTDIETSSIHAHVKEKARKVMRFIIDWVHYSKNSCTYSK